MSPIPEFRNEPTLELRRPTARESLLAAIAKLDAALPLDVPVIVAGERRRAGDFASTDPGKPDRIVATAAEASASDIDAAVVAAAGAEEWRMRPAEERAATLATAAGLVRERRLELASLEVRECAKPWSEADADVCEAIDFLEYYAREAIRLAEGPELVQAPGERNRMRYAPRGAAVVISPWNFPLAIPTGMAAAALAAGNGVVLKPAEQSPATALALVDALLDAGVPPAAVNLLPGHGEAGAALVRHPNVHVIAFTGSSAVGLEILARAGATPPGQTHVKRVVAEMGGKNCAIVDADADLDEAVPAIVHSAYSYAGQKCSAIARVLAHEAIATSLSERLSGAVTLLEVGQADRFETDVPPLIEEEAQRRVAERAARAAGDGRRLVEAEAPEGPGWFCPPTLCADLDASSPVLTEEVFGPVLTIETVPSVEVACERVEALPFALTGSLFSRNPSTVDAVVARSPVGNLYVNRASTGAMVARQPFGGNRLSGAGSKAGGPDYLLQFMEPRVVTENTTRHGLVVE